MNAAHIRGWQAAILAGLLLIGLNAGAASARLHDPDLTAQAIAAHASITHGCWLARVGTEITSKAHHSAGLLQVLPTLRERYCRVQAG